MASGIFSPRSQVLPNTALLFGLVPTFIGVATILYPRFGLLHVFEAKLPAAPQDQKLVDGLMRLFGARDMYLGLTTITAWYMGQRAVMGYLLFLGCGVVTVDGIVQKQQTGNGEWKHWSFVPVMAGLGAGLVGWLDRFA